MTAHKTGREWVGGRVELPFYVRQPTPFRPMITLWMEMPEGIVIHHEMAALDDPEVPFGVSLLAAMAQPLVGSPRRPATIRVSDPELANQVRSVAPEIQVVVSPTPELLDLVNSFKEYRPSRDTRLKPSYFEHGDVREDTVESLFTLARRLKKVAPWKAMRDGQIVRVDIPQYGVEAACLTVIGALGQDHGLLLFPSRDGFQSFLEAADRSITADGVVEAGSEIMSLTFERLRDLPPTMRKEVARHGWAYKGETRVPVVQLRDADGIPRPISDDEVDIMAACAGAFAEFFTEKRDLLMSSGLVEPTCVGYRDDFGVEVRFTYPYEAGELYEVNAPRSKQ